MKKWIQKAVSFIMALSCLYMAANAVKADGSYTITVSNSTEGYAYQAYQIFTGTLAEDGTLSDIQWGSGITAAGKNTIYSRYHLSGTDQTAAKAAEAIAEVSTSAEADAVATLLRDTSGALSETRSSLVYSNNAYSVTVSDAGWYLVVNSAVPSGDVTSYSDYIVQVVRSVTISPKSAVPSSMKHVDDQNDSDADDHSEGKDSADYDVGDTVPYTLTAVIPSDYANYEAYYIVFEDDMCPGLTYDGSARIYYGASDTTGEAFTLSTTQEDSLWSGTVYQGSTGNLKLKSLSAGDTVSLTYTCTLNQNAVRGSAGNPNRYRIHYTNNPNDAHKTSSYGTTPWDKNVVYTYQTVFRKVDEDGKPLTGADFTLYKYTGTEWVNVTSLHNSAINPTKTVESLTAAGETAQNAKFTFSGLDAGQYKLVETTTPSGFNTMEPVIFAITASHSLESEDPSLTSLTGSDGADFTMTSNLLQGSLTADIENHRGSRLPSTGGSGTMVIRASGIAVLGILVLRFLTSASQKS